eukprot:365720-Chlamydomonas_euryale.AAC.28
MKRLSHVVVVPGVPKGVPRMAYVWVGGSAGRRGGHVAAAHGEAFECGGGAWGTERGGKSWRTCGWGGSAGCGDEAVAAAHEEALVCGGGARGNKRRDRFGTPVYVWGVCGTLTCVSVARTRVCVAGKRGLVVFRDLTTIRHPACPHLHTEMGPG